MPTIVLFDIDGTLLSSGGAGRRAIDRAFLMRHGRGDACTSFSFAGRTDRAIVRLALEAIGAPATAQAIDEVLELYLRLLVEEMAAAHDARLHPGIVATLDALERLPDVAIGLGTGNVEPGARIKLSRVGIAHRFAFGGFGSDHEDRARLLQVGVDRGVKRLGVDRSACKVLVVGDTPRDVQAAHAIGALCVAVATGPYDAATLRACGPAHVLTDLADPQALLAAAV